MRTTFNVLWPVSVLNKGRAGIILEIDWLKMFETYPFLEGANFQLTDKSVKPNKNRKKSKSRAEQAEIYRKLLKSGAVKNKAGLAKKFSVSRSWITQVLS